MQGFKNRRYEYEEKFVLGSGDSHSDSRTDGGTDRTGNYELHGLRPVLNYELHTVQIIASEKDNISSISLVIWRIFVLLHYFQMFLEESEHALLWVLAATVGQPPTNWPVLLSLFHQ